MTNYQNDIMELLEGDTPRQKYECLKSKEILISELKKDLTEWRRKAMGLEIWKRSKNLLLKHLKKDIIILTEKIDTITEIVDNDTFHVTSNEFKIWEIINK